MHKTLIIATLLALSAACEDVSLPIAKTPVDIDPIAAAGLIAARMDADPSRSDSVLAEQNITPEEWDALMYDIAADPAKTAKFEVTRAR